MNTADVTIESIAAGGDGVGRTGGVVVFVPRTAPGDYVRVVLEQRKRFARGTIDEILAPSKTRIDPLCYHYRMDRCGGCQLQHMHYDAQLEAKRGIVRDSLTRIGKREIELPVIEPSRKEWRYRRKLTLAMRRGTNSEWVIGLHRFDDPVGVFQIADCPITDEGVMEIWRQIMEARSHFPPADELRASVQLTDDGEGASVLMEGGHAWPDRTSFFEVVSSATSLWWRPTNRARALVAERGRGGALVSFAQVNPEIAAQLHEYVIDRAQSHRPRVLVDAYAGSGATAIPLARAGIRVAAIELDRDAADACASRIAEGSRVIAARVEDALPSVLPADVVLLNPPRAGVHERVTELLQATTPSPRAVIYVSCDPATLGRDIGRLSNFRIASLRTFDMFPQTAHVETVCELVPEDRR